ncbi:MAG TPA: hypothetical protein VFJ94_06070 [Intrasporangium sp.]|nr:hypothetical protein [Intrasporangium sp.]
MVKRRWLVAAGAVIGLAAVVLLFLRWWTSPRLEESGGAVAVVDGRSLSLVQASSGVGISGRLGLLGGRCVGLAATADSPGRVIVWPPGTTLQGEGADLRVESGGHSVRIGEAVEGGSEQRQDVGGHASLLPPECSAFRLVDVSLGR